MPRYAILRDVDPNISQEEIDAAVLQQLFNLAAVNVPPEDAFDPDLARAGIGWVRSYVHRGTNWGMCLYSARSIGDLEVYHDRCDVPYVAITEVEEIVAPRFAPTNDDPTPVGRATVLLAIEAGLALPPETRHEVFQDVAALLAAMPGSPRVEDAAGEIEWVRTYWDGASDHAVALYAAPNRESADALRRLFERAGATVHTVTEVHPGQYGRA